MRGFVNITPVPRFNIDELHTTGTLALELDEGKQFRFGQIKVLGLDSALAEKLLHESGLEPGRIFDTSLVSKFFARNRDILPADASPFEDTERQLDERNGTVDIAIDVRGCPQLPEY
jgi:outer membrane protein assembly factor BamA